MNILVHVFLLQVGASSGYIPRSDITGSSVSAMTSFLSICQNDFQSGFTSLQSHMLWKSVTLSPYYLQHFLSLEFFILAILTGGGGGVGRG